MSEDQPKQINPLLGQAKLPGFTVRLPSQGVFYTNGELDPTVRDGEVHVHPMTTMDELTIRNADKVMSGDGVKEVIGRCVPTILQPGQLFAKDVDFLLVCLRKVSYGASIDIDFTHVCDDIKTDPSKAKTHSYQYNLENFINNAKEIDPTAIHSMFEKKLNTGQLVKIQPMRFDDFVSFMQATTAIETVDEKSLKQITNQSLLGVISAVDGVEDKALIEEWLDTISPATTRQIDEAIQKSSDWGTEVSFDTGCKGCEAEITIEVSLNPLHFFI